MMISSASSRMVNCLQSSIVIWEYYGVTIVTERWLQLQPSVQLSQGHKAQ